MIKKIIGFFSEKRILPCGGDGCCEAINEFGKVVTKLYYRRPTSDERLGYLLDYHKFETDAGKLKKISKDDPVKSTTDIIWKTVHIPWAEKIFVGSEGYLAEDKTPLEKKSVIDQFKCLKKYYANHLAGMCDTVFVPELSIKKKN